MVVRYLWSPCGSDIVAPAVAVYCPSAKLIISWCITMGWSVAISIQPTSHRNALLLRELNGNRRERSYFAIVRFASDQIRDRFGRD